MVKTNTRLSKPPVHGTHLRWMALCPMAWRLIVEGLIPVHYSTPPIVEECGKKQHDKLLEIVDEYFHPLRNRHVLARNPTPRFEYSININGEWRSITLRPDLYLLMKFRETKEIIVNIIVEVTTRSPHMIPVEWLTAYSLGAYLLNMQPTVTLLVTPFEVKALPLSTKLMKKLDRILNSPSNRKPASWLCSNCDLRPVCPNPVA